MLKLYTILAGFSGVILLGLVHVWNHRAAPIPGSVNLRKIVIGVTDVDGFVLLVPGAKKYHSCRTSHVGIYVKCPSIWYSRDVSIEGEYFGANTGYHSNGMKFDGDSLIKKIEVVDVSRFNVYDGNWVERIFGAILQWDYENFK